VGWVGSIPVLRVGLNPHCVWFEGLSHSNFFCLVREMERVRIDGILTPSAAIYVEPSYQPAPTHLPPHVVAQRRKAPLCLDD
jgi:hypothetical protein